MACVLLLHAVLAAIGVVHEAVTGLVLLQVAWARLAALELWTAQCRELSSTSGLNTELTWVNR